LTFLNPIALIGLLAAGIPILLHIFNLRKLKTIEFSTLTFLKELQKTKIRRLKLRQLLLLVLRTLLVVLVVFAFSRPTLKGSLPGGLAEQAKTTAVIVFDDSQSMTASDEQGELLHQAKNAAIAVMNLLKDGDEVFLLKLSDVPVDGTSEIPTAQRNFPAIRSAVNEIKPSSMHRTVEDALRFTARLLAVSQNFNKEVYLVSDFQSGSLESKTHIVKTNERLFVPTTQFFLIPLGKRELQNVSIESIEIPSTIFEVNRSFAVKAKLTNHGTSNLQNHVVSVYQDGSRVGQKGIDIRAGQSEETEFKLVPKHSGFLEGKIELEDDDLEFDNTRFFTVHIPEGLHILLVGSASDLTYLRIALATRLTDSSASLKIDQITSDRFSSSQLNNTDVVVFSNLRDLTHDQSFALKTYLQNGGGMLFFPGTQTTRDAFNTVIAAPLGISTVTTSEDNFTSQSANSFIEFDKVDLRHPLFAGMFEETEAKQSAGTTHRQRVLESPRISKSFHFVPTPKSQSIITLTNGYSFLMEERIGSGQALLFSVAANTEWSDFPLKGLFVPLMHRSLAYLSQESVMEHSLLVGEETTIHLRTAVPQKLTITKPGGLEIFINPRQLAAERSIQFFDNDLPGLYTVASGNVTIDKFAVNVDPDESNTTPSDEKHLDNMFRRIGITDNSIHIVNQVQEVQRIITESRLGAELWKQFLIAALLIAIIEMFVARDNKRYLSLAAKQIK
jgi:hypothetical protein